MSSRAYESFSATDQPVKDEALAEDPIESLYRLSWMQEGLLIHSLLTPQSDVYFRQTLYSLEGALDVAAFERAWRQVLQCHSILRTAFLWKDVEQPLQVVFREAGLRMEKEDWRGLAEVAQESRLQRYLETNQERGFNLSEAPLMRLGLMRVADDRYHLVFAFHHLLLDGWSHTLVLKEVKAYYEAYTQGRELQLPAPRPYRDYIHWLEDQDFVEAEAWWRECLRGFRGATPLPFGGVATLKNAQDHGMRQIYLSPAETLALRDLARQHQLTLNTLVQGAWALLLSRHSEQRDVVFGATVAGRNPELAGVESMVGVFINTVPVRVQFHFREDVLSWLKRLQAEQAIARRFDYTPLVEVQRWSEVAPGQPLFETLLVFENYSTDSFEDHYGQNLNGSGSSYKPALKLKLVELEETVNYPLALIASPGEKLLLRVLFHLNRFAPVEMERLLGQLRIILQGITANPGQTVKQVPWMTSQERQQVIEAWNRTEKQYTGGSIISAIEAQAKAAPQAPAVAFEGDQLTYRELNERANRMAHYLRKSGIGPESRVGVCMERSPDLVIGLLAILKAGAAYVPLDPDYPPERLAYMLEDSQCVKILVDENLLKREDFADLLAGYADKLLHVHAEQARIEQESAGAPGARIEPEHLAYVIYTSGSTGRPKGAMNTHGGLRNRILWMQETYNLGHADRVLQKTPFSFDVSVWEFFWPLMTGACLVLARPGGHQDPEYLGHVVQQHQITTMHFVPSMLRAFLESGAASQCASLRRVICSGEALGGELAEKCLRLLPQAELHNLYGPTEAAIDVTAWKCEMGEAEKGVAIGKPIANMQVYVLDEEMEAVPVGAAGELYLGGVGLARGYMNGGRLTAEKFLPNPFGAAGTRLYRTGDVCRWRADGNLEFMGRADYQIKIHGYRIELDEINSVLLEHPDIKQAVVLARDSQAGEKILVAYVVIHEDLEGVSVSQFRAYLQGVLPHYMVPAAFVLLKQLPLTSSGKVDRKALTTMELTRTPSRKTVSFSPVEEIVAGIWCDVLKTDRVGLNDNFFGLGGHSILATQVISRVQNVFQIELPFRALFDAPTVVGLAAQIEQGRRRAARLEAPPLKRVKHDRLPPLSFAQQRLWFLNQLYPDSPAYNIPLSVVLVGELNRDALRRSMQEIIRRHEVLRTRFPQQDGVPVQKTANFELNIEEADLRHLDLEPREAEARRWMRAEAAAIFDLEHGPVLRVRLLRTRDQKHVLLLTIHHIASDGWSMGVMLREFAALYEAFCAGRETPLPELELQYADYAIWQRQWLTGEVLNQQLDYWRKQLADLPVLELPAEGTPASDSAQGNIPFELPAELTEKLRELSRQEGVTLFMTVLGGWQIALARFTGQEDITVATAVANRRRVEIEAIIGFFVNTLLLRTQINEELSFSEILGRVRETVLGAYDHQDVPFEKVVEEVHPTRDPRQSPLFRVMLAMQTAANSDSVSRHIAGLEIHPIADALAEAKHDLTLYLNDNGASLAGIATFKPEVLSRMKVHGFLENFKFILSAVAQDRTTPISTLPWPDMQQLEEIVADFSGSPDYLAD